MSEDIKIPYELPEGWKWCRLGDVCKFENGYAFKADKFSKTGIPVIRITNIKENEIDLSDCIHSSETNIDDKFLVRKGDLLIAMSGATTGKNGVYLSEEKVYLNQRVGNIKVIDNKILNDKFRNFYIQEKEQEILRNAYGGAQPNISSNKICEMLFPLPPTLEEQQRIVNRIETLFAKLDLAKEKAQNVVDTFETRKASILHKAFTGELTKKWRAENGVGENQELELIKKHAEQLSKKDILNINTFQESVEDFILDDGTIWKKCQIGAIGIVTNGSTPSRKEPSYWNGTIPWVSSGEVANNIIEYTNECISEEGFNNSSVKRLPVGTVLIAMIGEGKTRGQSSVLNIEATTNQNIAAIIIDHGRVEPKLLWYWLQKEYKNNREAGNGSGPQALNCQRVRELSFILPTLPEQTEIVRILDAIFEKETKAKEAAEAVLEQIDLLKKSILARAFRGRI